MNFNQATTESSSKLETSASTSSPLSWIRLLMFVYTSAYTSETPNQQSKNAVVVISGD